MLEMGWNNKLNGLKIENFQMGFGLWPKRG